MSRRRAIHSSRDGTTTMMMIVIIGWGLMASHDPSVSFLES
jgi:hypothetical protein|tara:strand:+ start:1512 stop:1634 length:123 start_codon:yes stop_codon:yes gene_type:complete